MAAQNLTNPAWRDGRLVSSSRAAAIGMWIFAVLWNAVAVPLVFIVPDELAKQNWAALLGLLFPLVGLGLLYAAIRKTLQWRRFGGLALTLKPFPGAVGGGIGGTFDVPERFSAGATFRITLTCVNQTTTRSGGDSNTWQNAVWQNEAVVHAQPSGRGSQVSFTFAVPAGLPASETPSSNYHYWMVNLQADLPGVDLDQGFQIPVAASAKGSTTEAAVTVSPAPAIPSRIVRIEHSAGATVFYYPLFRNFSVSFWLLIMTIAFGSASFFMSKQATTGWALIPGGFMVLAFGTLTLGLLLFALYSLANTLRVEISPRGLTATRRVFGMAFTTHVPLDEIAGIESKIGMQSYGDNKIHVRYTLYAQRYGGRRIAVGDDIPGQLLADHLARLLREACGIRMSRS